VLVVAAHLATSGRGRRQPLATRYAGISAGSRQPIQQTDCQHWVSRFAAKPLLRSPGC